MTTETIPKVFILRDDMFGMKKGTEVFPYAFSTYGIVGEEEERLGCPCRAVTADSSGAPPFTVVPQTLLEPKA